MISVPLLLAALGATQAAVTYSTPAESADRVLAELTEKASVRLVATPEMAKEVLVVRVADVPLDSLMAKIATVTDGSWEKTADGYRLTRPPATKRAREQERLDADTAAVRSQLESLGKRTGAGEVHFPTAGDAAQPSPADRLLDRLAVGLDPQELARLEEGKRAVYAISPTQKQLRLGKSAASAWRTFLDDWAAYADSLKGRGLDKTDLFENFGDQVELAVRRGLSPVKAILIAAWTPNRDRLELYLRVAGADATVIAQTKRILTFGSSEPSLASLSLGKPFPADELGEWSPLAAEWVKAARSLEGKFGTSAPQGLSAQFRDTVSRPAKTEPLSLVPSEALTHMAGGRAKQLVASLPDDAALAGLALAMGVQTQMKTVRQAFEKIGRCRFAEDGDWMLVSPISPADSWRSRIDRDSLQAFLTAVEAGRAGVEEYASFAAGQSPAAMADPCMSVFTLLASDQSALGRARTGQTFLRFFGRLSPTRRRSLLQGEPFPLTAMIADERALVSSIAYAAGAPPYAEATLAPDTDHAWRVRTGLGSFILEPTEAFAGGLPADSALEVKVESTTAVVPAVAPSSSESPATLAFNALLRERPALGAAKPGLDEAALFRPATTFTYRFRLSFPPALHCTRSLAFLSVEPNADFVPFDRLPSAFLDEYRRKLEEYRSQFKEPR